MATLKLVNVNKTFDNKVKAVNDFNLTVEDKEFVALIGPSGCGKTTILRMVSGLSDISSGEIYINDELINDVQPSQRDIAMVFQTYALYPNMNVRDNMSFALKVRKVWQEVKDSNGNPILVPDSEKIEALKQEIKALKKKRDKAGVKAKKEEIKECKKSPTKPYWAWQHLSKEEIDKKVDEAAEILDIKPLLNRKPSALSGGQKQRVALGRAIVRNPKLFLMDEPLSNLDVKLRAQMRSEIVKIHQKVGATTLYVTHDQTEAMTMSDRIVVMKDGKIQQVGTPREVFDRPNNVFVATFFGTPAINMFNGQFNGEEFVFDQVGDEEAFKVKLNEEQKELLKDYVNKSVIMAIRPESVIYEEDSCSKTLSEQFEMECDVSELLGTDLAVYGYKNEQRITVKTSAKNDIRIHDSKKYAFIMEDILFFDVESSERIKG